jgi:hypothetical protein
VKQIRFPRLHWPHRTARPEMPEAVPSELGGVLRFFRIAALTAIAAVISTASAASFAESYRGLWLWAGRHALSGFWQAAFPLQIDVFIVVGELSLFIAMLDRWGRRERAGAWTVALLGLAASVAGNVGHVAAHDLQSRATAAVPPVAAFAALWVGLGVLKRIVARHRARQVPTAPVPRAVLPEIPADAETAALLALRATTYAGNPLSGRQLETQFGLSRAQATRVRQLVLAKSNGHAAANGSPDADS